MFAGLAFVVDALPPSADGGGGVGGLMRLSFLGLMSFFPLFFIFALLCPAVWFRYFLILGEDGD